MSNLKNEYVSNYTWQNQYLSASFIDHTTTNTFYANDFFFLPIDRQLRGNAI